MPAKCQHQLNYSVLDTLYTKLTIIITIFIISSRLVRVHISCIVEVESIHQFTSQNPEITKERSIEYQLHTFKSLTQY